MFSFALRPRSCWSWVWCISVLHWWITGSLSRINLVGILWHILEAGSTYITYVFYIDISMIYFPGIAMHLWRRCLWRINPTLILWRILDSGFLPKETASQPVRLFLSHYIKPGKTGTQCIRTSSSWISSDFCRNCAPTKNFQLEKINFFKRPWSSPGMKREP